MYVTRPDLEPALLQGIRSSKHCLLFGESGNGKSWLFKRVLETNGIPFVTANCANAARNRSLTAEICSASLPPGTTTKISYSESKGAEVSALFAKGDLKHESQYSVRSTDPLLLAFKTLSAKAKGQEVVIVFDNLESIFSSAELMQELANIIILLDDPTYGKLRVKFLIVGTPAGVLEYFEKQGNLESVSNRIRELPKVDCLTRDQVASIVRKGFITYLSINATPQQIHTLIDHVFQITLGVAQRVHEYCETLATELSSNQWIYSEDLRNRADQAWLIDGLRQAYTVVESHMNSRKTTIARRNQVLFSIGKVNVHQFDTSGIEAAIRQYFPETASERAMGVGAILNELASGEKPLLVKNKKTNYFRVRDPRFVMCTSNHAF